jgi:hypothetical protein
MELYKQKRRSFSFKLGMKTINFMWELEISLTFFVVSIEGRNCDKNKNISNFYVSVETKYKTLFLKCVGRDDVVCIATRYGLDGPVIESRWRRDFPHSSRPALGTARPAIQ